MTGQREAIKSDFQTQLMAEKERWQLIGGLVRRWVREALGWPGDDLGLKLYFKQMEDRFDKTATFDPNIKIIGWQENETPICVRLNRTATFVELEDGKSIFKQRVKEGETVKNEGPSDDRTSQLIGTKKPPKQPKK
jgi:hypothetical protein